MSGFNKFDLVKSNTRGRSSSKKDLFRRKKLIKIGMIAGGVLLVIVLFTIFFVVIPGKKVYSQAQLTYADSKMAFDGIKGQNIDIAATQLDKAKADLAATQDDLAAMGYLRFVPIANFYYGDATHLLQAGKYGINAAQITVDAIKPYADLLGLKGQGSFAAGSAQQRIQTAVLTLGKITPRIDDLQTQLSLVRGEIDAVDINHYPPFFGGQKVRDRLNTIKTITDQGVSFVDQAKPLIKVLPSVLGEPTQQRYLVLFQNSAERRPTGGFLTAYAIFSVSHGVIKVDSSNDIYTLDDTISNKTTAPRPILEYLPKVPQLNLRDTNLSPDFVVSMQMFNDLYKRAGGYQKVDGIIAVDTHALVAAMNILGDMDAGGQHFTTQTDSRCNCPQVIYQLESSADRPVNYVKSDRKSVIGDLMYAIMNKAFSSSPKKYWGALFQAMITETAQKHLLFDLYNSDAQQGIESLNAAGRIVDVQGDYLHVNDANFGGAKANLYTSEKVDQKYSLGGDGTITKTVTITYKNPYPPSDCNLERGNLCLNAPLRNWLRVYVPKGSKMVSSSGSEVKVISYDELGKTVFEGFLIPKPLGVATFAVTYTLPFKLAQNSPLPLLIQKQPGVDSEDTTIQVDDRTIQAFPLLTDVNLKLNLR